MIVSAQCDLRYAPFSDLQLQRSTTGTDWLSQDELESWRTFRSDVRRNTFLAGRILAKRLLRAQHCTAWFTAPSQITICSNNVSSGVRPYIKFGENRLGYSLSISHTCDAVLVGGTNRSGVSVGVDLVEMRSLSAGFERSWLTDTEIALLHKNKDHLTVADIWAMKEAVYKAVHNGESFAPRNVEICPEPDGIIVFYRGKDISDRCKVRVWRFRGQIAAVATYQRLDKLPKSHFDNHDALVTIPSTSVPQTLSRNEL
ncbi:4'-phosphopantetheinyl transferase family protein [Bythopirellula goksoeyrii]|uniref:4'-phosphopantetheinyl transferase n=1 Tax=Bythopirellula goksoeyrii TaxID=1400387 RepID=A0A5B9QBE2_9BACT|nr:4'-phosphopantetheinyl transferase family protein [Bythopirellula goksoeyrii]QEG35089.1 4'-phosphopantetheinyl transferase [Bythopirellula goksoeyrii]